MECDNHMWRVDTRTLPPDIKVDGGSDWIAIHRNYSHYLITNRDNFLEDIKRYYRFTLLPAEVRGGRGEGGREGGGREGGRGRGEKEGRMVVKITFFVTVLLPHCPSQRSHVCHLCQDQSPSHQLEQEAGVPVSVQARGGLVWLLT